MLLLLQTPIRLTFSLAMLALFFLGGCKADPNTQYRRAMESAASFKEKNQLDEARLSLLAALKAKPHDAAASFELAQVFVGLKRFGEAVEAYETAINLDPNHSEARMQLASLLLAGKNFELAESHIRKLLEGDSRNIQALLLQGNIQIRRRDLNGALNTFQAILKEDPQNTAAIASLGDIALQQGDPKQAETLYTTALNYSPQSVSLKLALSDLYLRQGRTDEAISAVEAIVRDNPAEAPLRYNLAELFLKKGESARAEEEYRKLLESDAKRHDARDRLYDLFLIRNDREGARALTQALVDIAPNDPGSDYFRGRDAELNGEKEAARSLYLRALEGLGAFAPAFRHVGILELQLGRTSEGMEHLNQAVSLDLNDISARMVLAQHLLSRKELSQAKEHLERVLEVSPYHLAANTLRADIAVLEGDFPAAERIYQALQKTLPDSPVGVYKLALLEERRGKPHQAIELYMRGLALDRDVMAPLQRLAVLLIARDGNERAFETLRRLSTNSQRSQPEYKVVLGSVLLSKKEWSKENIQQARALFGEALHERPNFAPALLASAQLDEKLNDFPSAEESYKKLLAVQAAQEQSDTRLLLATTYQRQGKLEAATEQYRELLRHSPRNGAAANNLAWILATEGRANDAQDQTGDEAKDSEDNANLDEALRLALIAKEELPNDPGVTDTLGWVYYRRGSARAALPILEEAVELAKKRGAISILPEVLYHLGVVRKSLGDKRGASEALREALNTSTKEFPSKAEAEKLLLRL